MERRNSEPSFSTLFSTSNWAAAAGYSQASEGNMLNVGMTSSSMTTLSMTTTGLPLGTQGFATPATAETHFPTRGLHFDSVFPNGFPTPTAVSGATDSTVNINSNNKHLEQDDNELRNQIINLRRDLEESRMITLRLRDELRAEQNLRAEPDETRNQIQRDFASAREEYEQRLRRADEELRTRSECDWIISRDEIKISATVLGQGAWGWVKVGTFRGTEVAVKQMHQLIVSPHNREKFEREMQMAARCRHPNLLQFIGATNDNAVAIFVTERLDTDLRTLLGQRPLQIDELQTLSHDVLLALNYLHLRNRPIIHRDISSANVLLWQRGAVYRAKLSDYGAASLRRELMSENPGAGIYAAPEAATRTDQSTKMDVFSFGVLLCEMCTRRLPDPQSMIEAIRSITNQDLQYLIQWCTHSLPEQRPTVQDMLAL